MGHQGSKSLSEARVSFQSLAAVDLSHKADAGSSQSQDACIQRSVGRHPAQRPAPERPTGRSPRSHGHQDTTGLVYIVDNPTGGVWVKPREQWTRT